MTAFAAVPIDAEWSLEGSDAGGLSLSWRNAQAGAAESEKPGAARARSLAIALPPGSVAEAVLEAPVPGAALRISPPSRFRDVSIAALTFEPDGGQGPARRAPLPSEARIRVRFRKAPDAAPFRAAFAPPEEAPSERHLRGWIANYAQSRGFRTAPAPGLAKSAADGPSAGASLPKKRLVVKTRSETIQVLDFAALSKAGLPLSGIDPRRMRLYSDGREVPMYIYGEGDGHWDPGDYIEFIGKRASGQNTYNSLYTSRATFILAWEGGRLGLRAPAVPVASRTGGLVPTFPADAQAALPFRTREHIEEDVDILRIGSTSAEEIVDLGSNVKETELTDFWVWKRLGAEKDLAEIPFNLAFNPSTTAKGGGSAGSGSLTVTVNLKGVTNNPKADPDHHLKFILNGTDISLVGGVENDAIWEGQESYTWVSRPVNPSALKAGKNVLVIQKVNDLKTTDDQAVEVQDAYLNYIELDFPSTYAAVEDKLVFSNSFGDSTGLKLFKLTGFTTGNVSVWDRQGRKLTNFQAIPGGNGFDVTFLDTLSGKAEYIACALEKRETPVIRLDTLDDLIGTGQGADYLVITERELAGNALDSLVRFRAKQGMRTRVVMARHIYQAFGDGSMDPAAIRRFVAYAYKNWERPAPSYLVLVGDASQSFEKRGGETIVPFHPVNIRGWGVAANDDFYAKVSGDDDLADLFVGRIPAATQDDLSGVVHKTLLLETSRPQGHWSNKTLLISGFESSFTAQNYVLQGIATANDRQYSRLDLFPGSPHYKSAAQRTDFFDQLDSGFNLVSFVGHGGGAVWSDAGVLTLKAIDEGRLKGDYPVGLVSSITCLTGFFEDNDARSLGEEMVRLKKGGAAGFYGAAGYISNLAGEALSAEILKAAGGNAYATTGQIVTQAETMVKLRTGEVFLPVMAEFNLLGDPALGVRFPSRQGDLTLHPQVLSGGAGIEATGADLAVKAGDAAATILLGDSIESDLAAKVSGGTLSLQRTFPVSPVAVQNGKVLVHYWDEKESRVLSAPFSSLDWLLDSIALEPAAAAPGDSVSIRVKLNTAYARTAFTGGVVSYAVGGDLAPLFPGENQIGLRSEDGAHLASVSKVLLGIPASDLANPRAYLAFRLGVQVLDAQGEAIQTIPNLSSRAYSLPLADLPRLELPARSLHLPIQEKLGLWVLFHNKGVGTAHGLKVSLTRDAESASPVTDTIAYAGNVPMGGLDSVFFALADSMLQGKRIRATLIPAKEGDLAASEGSQDTVFHLATALLSGPADTLRLDTLGTFVSFPASGGKACRVFADRVVIASLPSHLSPAEGSLPIEAFRIHAAPFAPGGLVLGKTGLSAALPKAAAAPLPAWHYRDEDGRTWVKLDPVSGSASARLGSGFRGGLYALLLNQDASAPLIQLSSRGQILLQDDYVPLNTPIDVVLRDGEGVDLALHPPLLVSALQPLDSLNHAEETGGFFPTLARINFLPSRKSDRDSITVTARDISGNVAARTLAYRMGDDLKIRDLGSYPNPFADTAVFVYSLTDYCDKVELKIFSRAGRAVRSLEQRNVVGYQEVVWDGRTGSGNNVANGLYFLKVTAKAGGKETSKIFKLFKKQRK
ncbi:MAG TPA: C25 family cysteine peptidase [Fibrobacteria bacterium]|nr:C25 family cysteine peptidase [Fibrobacteria bacterium]